jgi:hypothetical protein
MRRRIFLGFASILILFIGIGLYALWLFFRIGGVLEVTLQDNHQSVLTGQTMKEIADLSANSTRAILLVLVVGTGVALSVCFATQRAIFKPIQNLTAVAKELGAGKSRWIRFYRLAR